MFEKKFKFVYLYKYENKMSMLNKSTCIHLTRGYRLVQLCHGNIFCRHLNYIISSCYALKSFTSLYIYNILYGLRSIGDTVNDYTFPPQLIIKTMHVVPIIVMQMSRTTIGATHKVTVDDDECSMYGCSRRTVAVCRF